MNNKPQFGKYIFDSNDIHKHMKEIHLLISNFSLPWHLVRSINDINIFASERDVNIDPIDKHSQYQLVHLEEQIDLYEDQIEYLMTCLKRNHIFVWDLISKLFIIFIAYHNSDHFRGIIGGDRV